MKSSLDDFSLILESAQRIYAFTPERYEDLIDDSNGVVQDALCMRFQVIGETLNRIRSKYPEDYERYERAEWQYLIAIRNIISHSYVSVDFAVLWDVAQNKLPELMSDFERIIDEMQETTLTNKAPEGASIRRRPPGLHCVLYLVVPLYVGSASGRYPPHTP